MARITPKREPKRRQYRVTFANPKFNKKVQAASLSTENEQVAYAICEDLERLCATPALWNLDPFSGKFGAYQRRAVEIFFKTDLNPFARPRDDGKDPLSLLIKGLAPRLQLKDDRTLLVINAVRAWHDAEVEVLRAENEKYKFSSAALQQRVDVLLAEVEKFARMNNTHVRKTLADAVKLWKVEYPKGRKVRTVQQSFTWVDDFVEYLPAKGSTRLAEIRATQVNDWLADMVTEPDEKGLCKELAPTTKQHRKTYLSAFFTWAQQRYGLSDQPVQSSMSIAGATSAPEVIDALKLSEITKLLDALVTKPYWRAWVAVAILAGPRFGEQASLTIDSVNLEDNYILIRASKTGRQRRVPIEKTVLRPILEAHVELRKRLQKTGKTTPERSAWLFPSEVEHGTRDRTLSEPGKWSSAFQKTWPKRVRPKDAKGRIWTFGPRQWRHTFGTALGQAGFTSLEIAKWMGNSTEVAEAHYIAVSDPGKRWPFEW